MCCSVLFCSVLFFRARNVLEWQVRRMAIQSKGPSYRPLKEVHHDGKQGGIARNKINSHVTGVQRDVFCFKSSYVILLMREEQAALTCPFQCCRNRVPKRTTEAFAVFLTSTPYQPSLAECDTPGVARSRPWNNSGSQRFPSIYSEFANRRLFSFSQMLVPLAKSQDWL